MLLLQRQCLAAAAARASHDLSPSNLVNAKALMRYFPSFGGAHGRLLPRDSLLPLRVEAL
jgi:hypothetical protein